MRVFLAGATGAIGRRLIPQLAGAGHEVIALTRSAAKAGLLHRLGAQPAVGDALDRAEMIRIVREARPEAVIHQLTQLSGMTNLRNFDRVFAATNRLRTEGAANLIEAARAAGAHRFIAQSYGSWIYRPGAGLATETDSLDPNPPARQRQSLAAIRRLEELVTGADGMAGVALRYGSFYGPGTNLEAGAEIAQLIRRRRLPVIGSGAGVWSFIHIDDAAAAAVAALERGSGIYNIADDDPAPVATWLPWLAGALGAPPPIHLPVWLARIAAGDVIVSMMTRIRGMSNARARRELGWIPTHSSWRQGLVQATASTASSASSAATP